MTVNSAMRRLAEYFIWTLDRGRRYHPTPFRRCCAKHSIVAPFLTGPGSGTDGGVRPSAVGYTCLALSYQPPIERRRDSNAAKPSSHKKVRLMAPPPDLRFTTGRSSTAAVVMTAVLV